MKEHLEKCSLQNALFVTKFLLWGKGFRPKKLAHLFVTLGAIGFGIHRFGFHRFKSPLSDDDGEAPRKDQKKVAVNAVFFSRLCRLLRIIIPSWRSSEFGHIVSLTLLLLGRTLLSIQVAEITGKNARYLVQRRWVDIVRGILIFAFLGIPASLVNSGLKYETNVLSLKFKKRLSRHINAEYLSGVNFYKAAHLGSRYIDNIDQRLTSDVDKFCETLSNLYSASVKPVIDVILFTLKLSTYVGGRGPLFLLGYYALSAIIKRALMPEFGKLTARDSQLEGDYRTAHQRLINNAEEIAFYNGSGKELKIIQNIFDRKYHHAQHVAWVLGVVRAFDNFLMKYGTSIAGYVILALPVFFPKEGDPPCSVSKLTQAYVRNRQLLIELSAAIAHMLLVANKVSIIAGSTARVSELLEVIRHMKAKGDQPFSIIAEPQDTVRTTSFQKTQWLEAWKMRGEEMRENLEPPRPTIIRQTETGGVIIPGKFIKFEDVSLVSPEGKVLVHDLSFEIRLHQNVMVVGPNGSGKSTLFRILGELWPLSCGTVVKPRKEDILFIPQKPYLVLGTLRDQIIYPHSLEEMKSRNVTDEDLLQLMEIVDPAGTITKQWGLSDTRDWVNTISGGQKQRIAVARLFYHRPLFAILDECTSAVSLEVEDQIYKTCRQLGITLFTVCHRESLKQYHDYILQFDGRGQWQWTEIREIE